MNRNQRKQARGPRGPHRDIRAKFEGGIPKEIRCKVVNASPQTETKSNPTDTPIEDESALSTWIRTEKQMTNRACDAVSEKKSFGQAINTIPQEQYQNLLIEQYGFDPVIPDTINQLKELKRLLCDLSPRVETSSQYVNPRSPDLNLASTSEESPWLNVDTVEEIDKFIPQKDVKQECPTEIRISDIPRVKIIAEKFHRYKKGNIELRRLDEKIVCVEYDVYDQAFEHATPIQTMRAFFSIKPTNRQYLADEPCVKTIPSKIKGKFQISNEDFKKLNEKEIEIIDGKISENKPYLDDLNRVLKRKLAIKAKQNKTTLDLKYLYEMAKRESPPLDYDYSNTNLLSKAELDEIKDLILQRRSSSAHGISRKTLKKETEHEHAVSESIFMEILENAGISAVSNLD